MSIGPGIQHYLAANHILRNALQLDVKKTDSTQLSRSDKLIKRKERKYDNGIAAKDRTLIRNCEKRTML